MPSIARQAHCSQAHRRTPLPEQQALRRQHRGHRHHANCRAGRAANASLVRQHGQRRSLIRQCGPNAGMSPQSRVLTFQLIERRHHSPVRKLPTHSSWQSFNRHTQSIAQHNGHAAGPSSPVTKMTTEWIAEFNSRITNNVSSKSYRMPKQQALLTGEEDDHRVDGGHELQEALQHGRHLRKETWPCLLAIRWRKLCTGSWSTAVQLAFNDCRPPHPDQQFVEQPVTSITVDPLTPIRSSLKYTPMPGTRAT